MAMCELCGANPATTDGTIEGAKLSLCENCADMEAATTQSPQPAQTTAENAPQPASSPDFASDYGKRVRTAREERGKTQEELARALNIKKSFLRRIENEEMVPQKNLARKLEGALDISLHEEAEEAVAEGQEQHTAERTIGDVADIED